MYGEANWSTNECQPITKNVDLEDAIKSVWDELHQESIDDAVLSFVKTQQACIKAGD